MPDWSGDDVHAMAEALVAGGPIPDYLMARWDVLPPEFSEAVVDYARMRFGDQKTVEGLWKWHMDNTFDGLET